MAQVKRLDGREAKELREISITRGYTKYAEGSVLIKNGDTIVLCNATVEDKVPPFLRGTGQGWITAEYSLLPRSTHSRVPREVTRGKASGRTLEIQRLIGRSLRAVVDLEKLEEKTIWLDCDVLQADGGTRTTAINGAFLAMVDAVAYMLENKMISQSPLKNYLAATSVGIIEGQQVVDLSYEEDSGAQVDMNIVGTDSGELVEIQGTAEGLPFSREELDALVDLGQLTIFDIIARQEDVLGPLNELILGDNDE